MVRVKYRDGKHDMVKSDRLTNMIEDHRVASFWRRTGWVNPNLTAIRGDGGDWDGVERRRKE